MIKILFLNIKTTFFRLFEWIRVIVRYYVREPRFIWIDCFLAMQYLFKSPHRISKDFLLKSGASQIYAYGETPLTTFDTIVTQCKILSKDSVCELGCGTARTCFWLHTFLRCQVVGIDYLPTFIERAQKVKQWMKLGRIGFKFEDMLQSDLSPFTVIYLYGTCLEETQIQKLVVKLEKVQSKTKVITVSYPLSDYSDSFLLIKTFKARFPWGVAYIFHNEKK